MKVKSIMPYRDDLDAALAENKSLRDENKLLRYKVEKLRSNPVEEKKPFSWCSKRGKQVKAAIYVMVGVVAVVSFGWLYNYDDNVSECRKQACIQECKKYRFGDPGQKVITGGVRSVESNYIKCECVTPDYTGITNIVYPSCDDKEEEK